MDSVIEKKSYTFSLDIINLCRNLNSQFRAYALFNQLLRAGTSIPANIHEAVRGYTPEDFTYKMSIALKEANETKYWINALFDTKYIDENEYKKLSSRFDEICRILYSIIRTSKKKIKLDKK